MVGILVMIMAVIRISGNCCRVGTMYTDEIKIEFSSNVLCFALNGRL